MSCRRRKWKTRHKDLMGDERERDRLGLVSRSRNFASRDARPETYYLKCSNINTASRYQKCHGSCISLPVRTRMRD